MNPKQTEVSIYTDREGYSLPHPKKNCNLAPMCANLIIHSVGTLQTCQFQWYGFSTDDLQALCSHLHVIYIRYDLGCTLILV